MDKMAMIYEINELDLFFFKAMTNRYKKLDITPVQSRIIMVIASKKDGMYQKEMEDFINSNSGIKSRIGYTFIFDDYTNEELKEILNKKIQLIQEKIKEQPQIEITYFIPDSKKDGGKYETICNAIQKIDMYTNEFVMLDDTKIDIDNIIDIQGNLFQKISF